MRALFWLFVTGGFLLLVTFQRVEVKRAGVKVNALKHETELKAARNQYMRFMIARESGPEAVYKEGEEAGLKLTAPKDIVFLDEINEK